MALGGNWRNWVGAGVAVAALSGCGTGDKPIVEIGKNDTSPTASVPGDGAATPAANPVAAGPVDPKLQVPFDDACVNEIPKNVPLGLPPDVTYTSKNCGQLNDAVARTWDAIKLVGPDGKPQTFVAELEVVSGDTALGTIELLMRPELAPNHVRNFIALAGLQYYDGLRFDRVVKQQYEGENGQMGKLVVLEAGSPVETAEPERSHLGYWVKPEFSPDVKHEEGTVGACLLACEGNEETASVRFYINLTPAPAMDGNFTVFAKVTKGLDVARKLAEQPVKGADDGPDQGRPVAPLTIKKVTVRAVPVVQ